MDEKTKTITYDQRKHDEREDFEPDDEVCPICHELLKGDICDCWRLKGLRLKKR